MLFKESHERAFIRELERQQRSERTINSYLGVLSQFAWWLTRVYGEQEAVNPKTITPQDIRAYRQFIIKERRLKAATINRMLAALSKFFALAFVRKWCRRDPTEGIKSVPQSRRPPKALDHRSLRRLLRACYRSGNLRDIAILEVFINTGIRVGELVDLRMEDLVLSPRKGRIVVRGKGETSRTLALNGDARRAVSDYLAVRPASTAKAVFLSQRHSRGLVESSVWRLVRKHGRAAGIEATPHALRHTFGTRLVREHGVDLATVAQLMGHADVNTTAIYAQPTQEDLETALEKLAVASEMPSTGAKTGS